MPALAIMTMAICLVLLSLWQKLINTAMTRNKKSPLKVKPIVGCEFYITENRTRKTFTKEEKDPRHHQILLAKNEIGYKNLVKLTSIGLY